MPSNLISALQDRLRSFRDPIFQTDEVMKKVLQPLTEKKGKYHINLNLGFPAKHYAEALRAALIEYCKDITAELTICIESTIQAHRTQTGVPAIPKVKNIIAVASGKGGVGKSTVATYLALALSHEGATVGLLDADIYGPSQPHMLGQAQAQPESIDGKFFEPILAHGLQTNSIGYLVDPKNPMIWRGPMATTALQQLAFQTNWHDLDYLIIDLPPGTGDIQLTLAQKIPTSGAVIVTTPQPVSLIDVRKAITMLEKVRVPILGVVENMSVYQCPHCAHEENIFGEKGAAHIAEEYNIPLLAQLPLNKVIRAALDEGDPLSIMQTPLFATFCQMALRVASQLSLQQKDYSQKFPHIVIENA